MMLGLRTSETPIPAPPTEHDIILFQEGKASGPKKDNFLLDLDGSIKSPWNKEAARVFAKHFIRSKLYPPWPKETIRDAFYVHLITVREHYRKQRGLVAPSDASIKKVIAARASRMKTVSSFPSYSLLSTYLAAA
jgi:hypothetical protein